MKGKAMDAKNYELSDRQRVEDIRTWRAQHQDWSLFRLSAADLDALLAAIDGGE